MMCPAALAPMHTPVYCRCWEVLLQSQRDEVSINSTKWWFHVYQTLHTSGKGDCCDVVQGNGLYQISTYY